jgi:hypothetical protein
MMLPARSAGALPADIFSDVIAFAMLLITLCY